MSRPPLHIDANDAEKAVFRDYWNEQGTRAHHQLLNFQRRAAELPQTPNLALRVSAALGLHDELIESSLREFPANAHDIDFEWSDYCSQLDEGLVKQIVGWIEQCDQKCTAIADQSKSIGSVQKAIDAMNEAIALWEYENQHPTLYEAFADLWKWDAFQKCLDLEELDEELLSDFRNTSGRVKRREISKRMLKRLEKSNEWDLPTPMQTWVDQKLEFWDKQMKANSVD